MQSIHGPFNSAGKYFCVVVNPDGSIHIWRSMDTGATWAESDSGNALNQVGAGVAVAGAAFSGTQIFISFYKAADNTLAIARFDCATNIWNPGALISGGPVADLTIGVSFLVRRSTGDFVVIDCQRNAGLIFTNVYTVSGGVFSGATVVSSGLGARSNLAYGMVLGTGDNTHLFTCNDNVNVGNTGQLYHVTYKLDNSLGALTQIDNNTVNQISGGTLFYSAPWDSPANNVLFIASADLTTGMISVLESTDVVNPVFSKTSLGEVVEQNGCCPCVRDTDGTEYVFAPVLSGGFSSLRYHKKPVAGIWTNGIGTEVYLSTGSIANVNANVLASIGLMFGVSTPATLFLPIGAPSPPIPPVVPTPVVIQIQGIIDLPSTRSCCLLCEQPLLTGLPRPYVREKSLTYASFHVTA